MPPIVGPADHRRSESGDDEPVVPRSVYDTQSESGDDAPTLTPGHRPVGRGQERQGIVDRRVGQQEHGRGATDEQSVLGIQQHGNTLAGWGVGAAAGCLQVGGRVDVKSAVSASVTATGTMAQTTVRKREALPSLRTWRG